MITGIVLLLLCVTMPLKVIEIEKCSKDATKIQFAKNANPFCSDNRMNLFLLTSSPIGDCLCFSVSNCKI